MHESVDRERQWPIEIKPGAIDCVRGIRAISYISRWLLSKAEPLSWNCTYPSLWIPSLFLRADISKAPVNLLRLMILRTRFPSKKCLLEISLRNVLFLSIFSKNEGPGPVSMSGSVLKTFSLTVEWMLNSANYEACDHTVGVEILCSRNSILGTESCILWFNAKFPVITVLRKECERQRWWHQIEISPNWPLYIKSRPKNMNNFLE